MNDDDDESLFSQVKEMILVDAIFENNGEEKRDGLTNFKQKEVWKTIVTRADIRVKLTIEVLVKNRVKEGNCRRKGAACNHTTQ